METLESRVAKLEAELEELRNAVKSAGGQLNILRKYSTLLDVINALRSAGGHIKGIKPLPKQ